MCQANDPSAALALRQRFFKEPFFRLVHAEADGLPGLIVDLYGDVLVVQANTAVMDTLLPEILPALQTVTGVATIVHNRAGAAVMQEGLDEKSEVLIGSFTGPLRIDENGASFFIDPIGGQKTGWFYDQRDNRARLDRYVAGRRVLDVFSYVGAWGIRAAARGAREVVCVDSSAAALELAATNAALNGVGDRVQTRQGDAFEVLKQLREARERFDVVIVDPPAFIKRRKDFKEGALAYRRLNEMAMQVLERDGLLVSCSCSQLLSRDILVQTLLQGARHLDRNLVILEHGRQGPDHPVPPAIPETDYLKMIVARVLPA